MYVYLAIITAVWFVVMFLHLLFKTCSLYPYCQALDEAGVGINPFVISWRITRFNRFMNRLGLYQRIYVKSWFHLGAIVTCFIFFPCFAFYNYTLLNVFSFETIGEYYENSTLKPVIPGINFPLSYWKTFVCITLISTVFHEFGHALAASNLRINVESVGFALIVNVPYAFVNLQLDHLRHSSLWEQMTVYCAGIWHNIVLSLSCLLILENFWMFTFPLFYVGNGVTIFHVNEFSKIWDPDYGFVPGDHIYAIGNCLVTDIDSYIMCLQNAEENPEGFCVPRHIVAEHLNSKTLEKCEETPDHLYFHLEQDLSKYNVCLAARTSAQTYTFCTRGSDCDNSSLCLIPQLPEFHRFITFKRHGKPLILFEGLVHDLISDVKVSEFFPRFGFPSPSIPETIKEFIEYLFIFSNGLAFLNLLPILSLDGVYISETLIHLFLSNYSYYQRRLFSRFINIWAHAVTILFIFLTIYKYSAFMYNV